VTGGDRGRLRRALGLPALTAYGVGGMLGGGIYALTGVVAGEVGRLAWVAFAVAMLVAAPTALSYAELAARFPRSGGESIFTQRAFGSDRVALLMGWTVIFSGIVSMGTLSHAFAGYLDSLVPGLPRWAVAAGFLAVLGAVNFWGIRLTSGTNVLFTGIELTGLLIVVAAGLAVVFDGPAGASAPAVAGGAGGEGGLPGALAVLSGATLAFYAYIGFEDMVNVAEEVRRPRRAYPWAIPLALLIVGATYMAVVSLSTAAVSPAALAESSAPLQEVVAAGFPAIPGPVFAAIALFAVANTALLNFVMASRLAYGMAGQRLLPAWLAAVHPGRRTPHRAIAVIFLVALALTLTGTLETLAATTSLLILAIFFVVDGALVWIKLGRAAGEVERIEGGAASEREGEASEDRVFRVPIAVPAAGMIFALALMPFGPIESALTAAAVVAAGLALLLLRRLAG
jgi:APA family basic amino acid/polyamine antiporter